MAQEFNDGATPAAMTGPVDQEPLIYLADAGQMVLPNEAHLLHADFARRDDDLLVAGADRPALIILDYFAVDRTPDLLTEGGAVLPAHVVAKLAGPDPERSAALAKGEDPASEHAPIGQVETLEGEVIIIRADGSEVIAEVGMPVFQDDVIITDGTGSVGLRFIDGMTLSLGSDARMVLDEFVYDPAAGEGGGIIEIIQGAFSFVSGAAAHMGLDSLVIDTPTMTIGIRGTKVVANAAAEGETTEVVLLPEDNGTIGKIMITTDAGQELLEEAFVATTVTSRFLPPAAQTIVTPDWVYSHYSQPLAALPTATVEEEGSGGVEIEMPVLDSDIRSGSESGIRHHDVERAAAEPADGAAPDDLVPAPKQSSKPTEPIIKSELDQPIISIDQNFSTTASRDPLSFIEEPDLNEAAPEPETPANQAPIVIMPIANTNTIEDAGFNYDISASFTDADIAGGDVLVFSAALNDGSALPPWLTINPTTGILSGTPANDGVESLIVTVSATDGSGASASTSFQLTVTNSNDAPLAVAPIADTGVTEDAAFTYDVSSNFADDDIIHGDSLSFSAEQSDGSPLPAWLSIDHATGILSGTPTNADVTGLTLTVMVTDDAGSSIASSFQLAITNSNDAPIVVTPIADTGVTEDAAFTYDVSSNFADDDIIHGDSLSFSAEQSDGSPLPAWLSIDHATGILSGTPTNADVTGLTLTVMVTDDAGSSIASSFQLTITNSNDAPIVVTPIADIAPLENVLLTYDVSSNFGDDDIMHGDSLTFSAEQSDGSSLPAWLTIDPTTGVLSGTPDATQVGIPYTLDVTATDGSGAGVTSTFQLSVDNVNDAPVLNVTPSPSLTAV
ncbi:MAG: putative Ig domain-containing protein, partial [Geminicoccales bacterium]